MTILELLLYILLAMALTFLVFTIGHWYGTTSVEADIIYKTRYVEKTDCPICQECIERDCPIYNWDIVNQVELLETKLEIQKQICETEKSIIRKQCK